MHAPPAMILFYLVLVVGARERVVGTVIGGLYWDYYRGLFPSSHFRQRLS